MNTKQLKLDIDGMNRAIRTKIDSFVEINIQPLIDQFCEKYNYYYVSGMGTYTTGTYSDNTDEMELDESKDYIADGMAEFLEEYDEHSQDYKLKKQQYLDMLPMFKEWRAIEILLNEQLENNHYIFEYTIDSNRL
jgi:mannose-1-phosphate guanylyltransferase